MKIKKVPFMKRRFAPLNQYDFNELAQKLNELIDALQGEGETRRYMKDFEQGIVPPENCGKLVSLGENVKGVSICQNPKGSCPMHEKGEPDWCCIGCGMMYKISKGTCPNPKCTWDLNQASPQPVSTEDWMSQFEEEVPDHLMSEYRHTQQTIWPIMVKKIEVITFIENLIDQVRAKERERVREVVEKHRNDWRSQSSAMELAERLLYLLQ